MNCIEAKDVSYSYPDGTLALDGFRLSVGQGDCLGLAGPNGSGKTTFMLSLAGFLEPSEGGIFLNGKEVDHHDLAHLRKTVGFTFHNPDDQLFMPTVLEDVCFGPLNYGSDRAKTEADAMEMLGHLGIAECAKKPPRHLSAGQKRLAALAGVLVMDPEIIVLDEPTAFLDPHSRRQIIRKLRELAHTKIIISHDLEMMLELCSRTAVMFAGRNAAEGRPSEIFGDPALMEKCRLEVPASLR